MDGSNPDILYGASRLMYGASRLRTNPLFIATDAFSQHASCMHIMELGNFFTFYDLLLLSLPLDKMRGRLD